MNKPSGLSLVVSPLGDQKALGAVQTPALLRMMRPLTFGLWLVVFGVEATTIVSTGSGGNWAILALSTVLFAGVHLQFWYEESDQGRRLHHGIERMRGRLYEDEVTGLPNSRHFVFELRRQMTRSVRNGRGFSLILTDIAGLGPGEADDSRMLQAVSRALRPAIQEGDFLAHLQGAIFAAIVLDDREQTAVGKAGRVLAALSGCIPGALTGSVFAVVSFSGYEGELQVRDYLGRSQRDLLAARSRGIAGTREQGVRQSVA
ncbi:MAG: GGDEF domain-containing protein [Tepidiformaceae bacterium]